MSNWARKWWPGLIPLALLWIAAIWTGTVPLETQLAARSTGALKDTVLDKTRVSVSGRDVMLSAEAFSEEGRRSATSQVEAVPGVRLVNDGTRLIAEAKPFVWSVERDVVRVTLGGNAPLPAIKAKLLEAARASLKGTEISDRMTLARGAPPRFDAAALLLLDQVGKLKQGKLTLSDTGVSLTGEAREIGSREAITAALRNLPEGYSVTEHAIKAPPYIFQANKDPVANTVTLAGYVPDNAVHAAIVAAIGRKFFSEKLVDNLKASVGAPQGFSNAAVAALGALSRVSTGSLVISDREIKLSGDALYAVAADQILRRPRRRAAAGLDHEGRSLGQAGCQRRRSDGVPAAVFRPAGQGADQVRIRPRDHRAGFDGSAGPVDRNRAALSDRQYRGRRPHRQRWRRRGQHGPVREARAGGGGLSDPGRIAGGAAEGGGLWQFAACRRQRHRRRQGTEPAYRFRGEVSMSRMERIAAGTTYIQASSRRSVGGALMPFLMSVEGSRA